MTTHTQRFGHWRKRIGAKLRSKLGENILSLTVVQGLNYVLPLVVLPYLLRILGPRRYGEIAFAQSLMSYAVVLTDFGFNLSATREISLARGSPKEVARIFWSTLAAKLVLLAIAAAVIGPAIVIIRPLEREWEIVVACGLLVVGSVAFPQWYFLGIERMRIIATISVITKFATVCLIFLFVRSAADYLQAAALLSAQQLTGALASAVAVAMVAPVALYRPTWRDIRERLAASWHLFLANAAGTLYLNSNAFLLGILTGSYEVAMYSLANKITLALSGLLSPIVQAVYPRASRLFDESPEKARMFIRRLIAWMLPLGAALSLGTAILAPEIVHLLAGAGYEGSIEVLRIMSPLPLVLGIASVLAQIVMINLGLSRTLSRVYLAVGILNLALVPGLALAFGAAGASISLTIVEISAGLLMLIPIRRAGFSFAPGALPSKRAPS